MGSTSLSSFKSCSSNQDSFVLTEGKKQNRTKQQTHRSVEYNRKPWVWLILMHPTDLIHRCKSNKKKKKKDYLLTNGAREIEYSYGKNNYVSCLS